MPRHARRETRLSRKRKICSDRDDPEQANSSAAMDDAGPVPRYAEKDFKKLLSKALKDTLALYDRLEKDGKLPRGMHFNPATSIVKATQRDLDGIYYVRDWMEYYFKGHNLCSPFESLWINRGEDGGLVLPGIDNEWAEADFDYDWCLRKSHQYTKLLDELYVCSQRPDFDWRRNIEYAVSFAKSNGLDLLQEFDIASCAVESRVSLHGGPFGQERQFYYFLINEEFEGNEGELWEEVQKRFPLVSHMIFMRGLNLFYPSGGKCKLGQEDARKKIEDEYQQMELFNDGPLSIGAYYRLKHKKALELGIIKLNEEGFYEDNFDTSTWKIS